jgi:hypothetical protein
MESPHSSHVAAFQPRAVDCLSPLHGEVEFIPDNYSTSWCTTPLLGALRDLRLKAVASIATPGSSAVADPAFF